MKVFNVKGEKFDLGNDYPTQDIEFNSTPALDLADAKTAKEIVDLRIKHVNNMDALKAALNERDDAPLQMARYQTPNTHMESTRFYSQTAYRFGDYVAKFSLVPSSQTQKELQAEIVNADKHGPDVLHRWLQGFYKDHDAEYLLQFQLCENLEDQPVEYAGKVWDPEKYPWQTVGRLVIPRQESFSFKRKAFWEDRMRIDPWRGLKSFQPLGSSNRLRRKGELPVCSL